MPNIASTKKRLIFIAFFLILPTQILAQSGDVPVTTETPMPKETPASVPAETPISVPTETPASTISAPATAGSAPKVTPTPVSSVSTPFPSPRPSAVISTTPQTTPEASVGAEIQTLPNTTAQVSNNLVLGSTIALVAAISAAFGYVIYRGKTQKKNDKDDRCGSIRELLEQKKKELETSMRNWPEEKIKALAKTTVSGELKKNEDAKKVIETAESLKYKHDKLKETIELLQKRYNLCMLELPSKNMKKQIIVIHGGDTFDTYEEYIKFLKGWQIDFEDISSKRTDWKDSLAEALGNEFEIIAPRMPNKLNAKYLEWKIWFDKFVPHLEPEVMLVGHSMGGIFLAKYLSENDFSKKVRGLFLVAAPFDDKDSKESLGDFKLPQSLDRLNSQVDKIFIYQSMDDMVVPFADLGKYKAVLKNITAREFKDRGHFNQEEFLEIVEDIKALDF